MLTDDQLSELLRGTGVSRANQSLGDIAPQNRFYVALGIIFIPSIVLLYVLTY